MSTGTDVCAALLEHFESDFQEEWELLTALRAQRATGADSDKARLRLDNLRDNSSTPERIVQGLEKSALKYLAAMKEHLHKAVHAAIKLEYANREIAATTQLIKVRAMERADRELTELYPETKRVIDQLYKKHGIAMGHFSTLRAEDISAIAGIIKKRFHEVTDSA